LFSVANVGNGYRSSSVDGFQGVGEIIGRSRDKSDACAPLRRRYRERSAHAAGRAGDDDY
jgi:hypothetical protein